MKSTRKKYTAEYKARVALAAVAEDNTVAQLAQEYEVHATLIAEWKNHLENEEHELFERKKKDMAPAVDVF
jgi:transposase